MGEKNLIWTNHASKRLRERGLSSSDVVATWRNPDQSRYAKTKGAWIFYRNFGKKKVEVVAKKNERGEWVILSVWSKPVYEKYQKKNKNIFLNLLQKLFGI